MKIKSILIISVFSVLLTFSYVSAQSFPITGDIYGEVFRNMIMSDAGAPTPYETTIENPMDCDNDDQYCFIDGFSWSDVIGWTYWDGAGLESELPPGSFPEEYQAKITYNGNMSGFVWGDKTGWMLLSACAGLGSGTCSTKDYCSWTGSYCEIDPTDRLPDVSSQNDSDWGVYLDFCSLKDTQPTCDPLSYCSWTGSSCVFDAAGSPTGQAFRGYAWTERLGWVKFGVQSGDVGFSGAFTLWQPDLTPPELTAVDGAWIPNQDAGGTIFWPGFAAEDTSSFDNINSDITVATTGGAAFAGCPSAGAGAHGNATLTQTGGDINLDLPGIGIIGAPPFGFCHYTVDGVIYNSVGYGLFLSDATALAAGVDPSDPGYHEVISTGPINLYVRAGDFSEVDSDLVINDTGTAIGDGDDIIETIVSPKDVSGLNAIIPVQSGLVPPATLPELTQANWVRDVPMLYNLNDTSVYYFDRLNLARNNNPTLAYPTPVVIDGQIYGFGDPITYPLGTPETQPYSIGIGGGDYLIPIVGYAPASADNPLELDDIQFSTIDSELPAISTSGSPTPAATIAYLLDSSSALPANPLTHSYTFNPMLEVTTGNLDVEFLVLGIPVQATYTIGNASDTQIFDRYALDHLLAFDNQNPGIGEEVLEIKGIKLDGLTGLEGRTDPTMGVTRYQTLRNNNERSNDFHNRDRPFHDPRDFFADDSWGGVQTDSDGIYLVPGSYYASPETSPPDVSIDRSDNIGFDLSPSTTDDYIINLIPGQFIGEAITADVFFGIDQYLAYKTSSSPATYPPAIYTIPPEIENIEVKSIGLGTSGVVSGEQVYETIGGRDLDTITTTSSEALSKEIRKNVASLTRTMTAKTAPACNASLDPTLNALPTFGDCTVNDAVNNTIITYYRGAGTVTLGSGSNVTVPPDKKYTLILDEGANLNIEENIVYGDDDNSLGIILLAASDGTGANVYIDPDPTNIVGLLYAEGSILSSPNAGDDFYYGAGADANDLSSQLFWQGSIASRNTIGGAPNRVVPDGVDCLPWPDTASCAQAYDLDFTRRFTVIDRGSGLYAPAGYIFSGGGSCVAANPAAPACSHGPLGLNLSTISIDGSGFIEPVGPGGSTSHDTFFIERDNRPVPPGFSSSGGLTSSQEIR